MAKSSNGKNGNGSHVPAKMGRPTKFTPKLSEEILSRMALGETLLQICRDDDMPDRRTVQRWIDKSRVGDDPVFADFRRTYEQARVEQAHVWGEQIIDIAEDGSNDWMERESEKGRITTAIDSEHVSRSRLRVDTRKFLMAKVVPHIYGDKTEVNVSGSIAHTHLHVHTLGDVGAILDSSPQLRLQAQAFYEAVQAERARKKIESTSE